MSELKGLVDIRGEDAGRQPIDGMVGQGDRLLRLLEALDREDGAEELLAMGRHAWLDVIEDGRLQIIALVLRIHPAPAGNETGPLPDRCLDQTLDPLELLGADDRGQLLVVRQVGPALTSDASFATRSTSSSLTLRATTRREPEVQTWPPL